MKRAITYVVSVLATVFLMFFMTWLAYIILGDPWQIVALVTSMICSPWIAAAIDKRLQATTHEQSA